MTLTKRTSTEIIEDIMGLLAQQALTESECPRIWLPGPHGLRDPNSDELTEERVRLVETMQRVLEKRNLAPFDGSVEKVIRHDFSHLHTRALARLLESVSDKTSTIGWALSNAIRIANQQAPIVEAA